ncbi:MAG TPA: hypothetical protein PK076_06780 [Saprospiraceae bacterium]|nr:hypothetical protein [Saprospiraceae bacterium]HQW55813.1 hypothetical protein [Saprospiraceae bacterium]
MTEVAKTNNSKPSKEFDFLEIGLDILIPFLLDNVFFRGTKGRIMKLAGSVAAQQAIKFMATSPAVDSFLDRLENWIKVDPIEKSNIVQGYPSVEEAIDHKYKKKRTKSKPSDYKDPERDMYI